MSLFIQNGADVNVKTKEGNTPLHGVIRSGHYPNDYYAVITCIIQTTRSNLK